MTKQSKQSSEAAIREIRRRTRRKFSPEEKIRIVLEGLCEICGGGWEFHPALSASPMLGDYTTQLRMEAYSRFEAPQD